MEITNEKELVIGNPLDEKLNNNISSKSPTNQAEGMCKGSHY